MKVKDLIAKLQEFDPELPVCLADWGEEYDRDNEPAAEMVRLVKRGKWWSSDPPDDPAFGVKWKTTPYVVIGR